MHFQMTHAVRRIARALAATTLLATCATHATGTIVPEAGLAYLVGDTGGGDDIGPQFGLGYYLDNGLGARALWFGGVGEALATQLVGTPPSLSFSDFYGVQLVDHFQLHEGWSLMVGAGIGKSSYDLSSNSTESRSYNDGIASVGLQWKPATHVAAGLQYNYLPQAGVGAVSLLAQFPF